MTDYGPSIKAARGENGEPMWQLLLSEALAKADGPDRVKKQEPIVEPEGTPKARPDAACGLDDPIPF
jgi:hypothetical protein